MSSTGRPFYESSNGDVWLLVRDPASGRLIVQHHANPSSGGRVSDIEIDALLGPGRRHSAEAQALEHLLGTMADGPTAPPQQASPSLTERLEACYTGVVHDVMRGMGLADFTFPPELRPIMPERAMAGPAFTVLGRSAPDADPHETLLAWTGLLSKAPAGSVWICQPGDRTIAQMGELSSETLKNKGVRGCVVDGLIRDTNFLLEQGFQSWCRGFTPKDIVGRWLPVATDVEIEIGEVRIAPGDYLLGDRDGLIRVPQAQVEDIVAKAEAAMATESQVRRAILDGVDPQEAYLRFGKF